MDKKETSMKRIICVLAIAALAAIFASCGGDGGVSTGTVGLFVTDDLSDYQEVAVIINSVSLRHTGTGEECTLFTMPTPPADPLKVDIAELSDEILLLSVSECEARSYNRIRVVLNKEVELTDGSVTQSCQLVSYKDESNNPNILACDPVDDTCTLDVNGAVNVFAGQHEEVALDFMLKDFEVAGFPGEDCSVTMKVSPLHSSGMEGKQQQGYRESLVGFITSHDAQDMIFTLRHGNTTYTVDYSGVDQQNIGALIGFAFDNNLQVKVLASDIGPDGYITATGLLVKVEGTVSGLDEGGESFTLQFNGTDIMVDYSTAMVEGLLAEGVTVEVRLSGLDGTTYVAAKVEVQ
jgi:hypothetical protein